MPRIYKIVTALFLLVILVEIICRITLKEQLKTRSWPTVYAPDSLYGYSYIPNSFGVKQIPGMRSEIKINSHGFHCRDFTSKKTNDAFRIFFVGRSEISAFHVSNFTEHFAFQLEQIYKAKGYRNVEVFNCGIDGRDRDVQNILMVKNKIVQYDPDIVLLEATPPIFQEFAGRECYQGYVLQYKINSKESRQYCIDVVDNIREHKFWTSLYDHVYIIRALAKRYMDTHSLKEDTPPDDLGVLVSAYITKKVYNHNDIEAHVYTIKKSMTLLSEVRDVLQAQGCDFMVLNLLPESKMTEAVFKEHQISALFLNMQPRPDLYNKLDQHLNRKGHSEVALRLFEKFDSMQLIPTRFR